MRRRGLPALWVFIFPNATPGVASLFITHSATSIEICPFCSHLEHHFLTKEMCLEVDFQLKRCVWRLIFANSWHSNGPKERMQLC